MSLALLWNIGWPELACIGFACFLFLIAVTGLVIFLVYRGQRRACPRCGESIPKSARVCRFCKTEIKD
jgi:predicted amidophosphoribosyltransferase